MDIRRVQITGGASFMITLPKEWANSVGLKKNDPVVTTPQKNGGLLLTAGGAHRGRDGAPDRVPIVADEMRDSDALYRRMIGAYIAGHSEIIVQSTNPIRGAMLEAISRFTQTSIGMEIVEEDEFRIVMKDLMDPSEVLPMKNVRRQYLLVKRMISDVFQSADDGDLQRISGMSDRDTEVDRIYWLVQRQSSIHQMDITLSARMGIDLRDVTGCVGVSKIVERMGDHAVLMAIMLESLKRSRKEKGIGDIMYSMYKEMMDLFDDSMISWLERDVGLAEDSIRSSKEIAHRFSDLYADSDDNTPAASTIAVSCRRLAEYCGDICESAINASMEGE